MSDKDAFRNMMGGYKAPPKSSVETKLEPDFTVNFEAEESIAAAQHTHNEYLKRMGEQFNENHSPSVVIIEPKHESIFDKIARMFGGHDNR